MLVCDFVTGERLETAQPDTQLFLRSTEDLFFRDPPLFGVSSVVSQARPDMRANRRNAYYRMFGLDLNHGMDDVRAYPYVKPANANRTFQSVLEDFLRETWVAIQNVGNTSGANPTDDEAMVTLARALRNMMTARRGGNAGTLSREEFFAVATMSWFHLAIEFNSAIVADLPAGATSPDERLRRIGQIIGIPAHSRTLSFLQLATNLSTLLSTIETVPLIGPPDAQIFYLPQRGGAPNPLRAAVQAVVTHMSIVTGRDLKAGRVTATPRSPVLSTTNGRVLTPSVPRLKFVS